MPRRREHCKTCSRHVDECGPLSKRGFCESCAERAAVEAARQMAAKSGPYYDRWLRSPGGKHV